MALIEQTILKQTIPPLIFAAYLLHLKTRKLEWVFNILTLSIIAFAPLFVFTRILGINILHLFLLSTWKTWATPAIYVAFTIIIYATSYLKTLDTPYSTTLAIHMALSTGYLYEAPRYLYLQGVKGMIRFNKHSLFYMDYAILSLLVILWLLTQKKVNITSPTILIGAATYLIYFTIFYLQYDWLREIRFNFIAGQVMIPWINLYRFPAMIMFLLAAAGGDLELIKLTTITILYSVVSPLDWLYIQLTGKPERRFID